jgi:transketolase
MSSKISNDDLKLVANTIRGLAMDGVEKAKSGHPGLPMGMADVATVLWLKHLEVCSANPDWPNRDRFILSAGHGSMLVYSLLHLAGYDIAIDDLQNFRQWESKTPGHPEHGLSPGVETTTGPLGQGCGNALGMAIAERMLAERYNVDGMTLVDHYTYVIASDGDLMEGISHEAFSLAGHLGLNKLVVFYDSNHITIEGETDLAYSDDVKRRFQGYNWSVVEIDAHDYEQVDKAIRKAKRENARPTIIICNSHIGFGSPNKVDTAGAHGEALGEDEVLASKRNLGLPENQAFYVPDAVYEIFEMRTRSCKRHVNTWTKTFKQFEDSQPALATDWNDAYALRIPDDLQSSLPEFEAGAAMATRSAGGKVIQSLSESIPYLVGGSADLAPSTKTLIDDAGHIGPGAFDGKNFHFGIREHAMAALLSGMALHRGFRVFGATFFVFLDYCRPSVRLASIMKLPVIYVFTHDSIFVGEDGPTHQPVEHLAILRATPGIDIYRPADATETAAAWVAALRRIDGPVAIALTRHSVPVLDRQKYAPASMVEKGAYVLWQSRDGDPDVLLIATGSEVSIALEAAEHLALRMNVRVVSMPCWEAFERQSPEYRRQVLPPMCRRRVAIEAGSSFGWEKYVGENGRTLCLDRFGASAPYKIVGEKLGFTAANIISIVQGLA